MSHVHSEQQRAAHHARHHAQVVYEWVMSHIWRSPVCKKVVGLFVGLWCCILVSFMGLFSCLCWDVWRFAHCPTPHASIANESYHTHARVMSRTWMSHECVVLHSWMGHVIYEWVMSHMNESYNIWMGRATYEWVILHMNESCHIWMSHVVDA